MTEGCDGLQCRKLCICAADLSWPQAVGSAVFKVVLHSSRHVDSLCLLMDPLLSKLSESSWEVLHQSSLWNQKKPVWFQAVLHLMEPLFLPAVRMLTDLVDSGRTWTLSHVPAAMTEVIKCLHDLVSLVPPAVFRLLKHIEASMPKSCKPLCGSVVVHFIFATIYR